MFDQVEEFYRPSSTREVLDLLREFKGTARVVAGGTDIVAGDEPAPRVLIDISRAGLNSIRQRKETWVIGAATTMADIASSPALREFAAGILARAAATCGSLQIRNLATIGGNMAHGSPAADLATPLVALNAVVVLGGGEALERIPIREYLHDHKILRKRLLTDIVIPIPHRKEVCGWSFQKLGRTALDISIVNAAVAVEIDSRQEVSAARIALGAVAPCAIRMPYLEKLLLGRHLTAKRIDMLCRNVCRRVQPITDLRASAEYRREMSAVLLRRALEDCMAQMERRL
jgi:carbon-monoxide dehydrogenase medium subunit